MEHCLTCRFTCRLPAALTFSWSKSQKSFLLFLSCGLDRFCLQCCLQYVINTLELRCYSERDGIQVMA